MADKMSPRFLCFSKCLLRFPHSLILHTPCTPELYLRCSTSFGERWLGVHSTSLLCLFRVDLSYWSIDWDPVYGCAKLPTIIARGRYFTFFRGMKCSSDDTACRYCSVVDAFDLSKGFSFVYSV